MCVTGDHSVPGTIIPWFPQQLFPSTSLQPQFPETAPRSGPLDAGIPYGSPLCPDLHHPSLCSVLGDLIQPHRGTSAFLTKGFKPIKNQLRGLPLEFFLNLCIAVK